MGWTLLIDATVSSCLKTILDKRVEQMLDENMIRREIAQNFQEAIEM